MALVVVQSVSSPGNAVPGITQTISSTGSGNLLLIAYAVSNSSVGLTISVASGTAQTFIQFETTLNSGGTGQLNGWYVKNCASGTTGITITRATGSGQMVISVTEVSGANTTTPLDQTANSLLSGNTGTTATTTTANEFWWGVFMGASLSGGAPTMANLGVGWTSDQNPSTTMGGANTDIAILTTYNIVLTTGTANNTATLVGATGNGTAGFVGTFAAASGVVISNGSSVMTMMGVG